jgi:hypothetical protein
MGMRSMAVTQAAVVGEQPVQPDSPTPFTPSGLTLLSVGW